MKRTNNKPSLFLFHHLKPQMSLMSCVYGDREQGDAAVDICFSQASFEISGEFVRSA